MKQIRRYIERWLGGMLMLLLLVACSKSSSEGGDEPVPEPEPKGKPVLKIYVFAPDRPVVTRGENDEVGASDDENRIHTLHVWVFEHGDGKSVGYINMSNVALSQSGSEVAIDISDDFINRKPAVDVFVAANVSASNCGITLGQSTTRTELEGMLIDSGCFGLSPLVGAIPGDGLPMSGVLKDQPVYGESPVLRVGSQATGLANVRLVRAVSKVRFVFCKSEANTELGQLMINEINLGYAPEGETAVKLPKHEYLFLNGAYPDVKSNIKIVGNDDDYEAVALIKSNINGDTIRTNDSPSSFSYTTSMTGQQYETLISNGIRDGYLSDVGSYYLRESNNGLAGTIKYKIGSSQKTKVFATSGPDEFTRNHVWVVYGYFVTSGELELNAVEIINWNNEDSSGEIYNW